MSRSRSSTRPLLAALLAVVVGAVAGAQDGVPVLGGDAPCESCRAGRTPPWHGSVVAGRGYPVTAGRGAIVAHGAADHCGPACRSCGPACRSCGLPGMCGLTGACHPPLAGWGLGCPYPLPPCLPRLHSWLREGVILSPQPLVMPRCHQCGAVIQGGF